MLAVGTATTGLSAVLLVLWAPGLAMDATAPGTPHELRSAVALGLVALGTASGLALIAAHLYSRIYPVRYGSSVWHEVLSDRHVPSGQLNFWESRRMTTNSMRVCSTPSRTGARMLIGMWP